MEKLSETIMIRKIGDAIHTLYCMDMEGTRLPFEQWAAVVVSELKALRAFTPGQVEWDYEGYDSENEDEPIQTAIKFKE